MVEQNALYTPEELEACATAAGFALSGISTRVLMEPGFYGRIGPGEGIGLSHLDGTPVDQAARLPSHAHLVIHA